jgi:hypothetical protein
MTIHQNTKIGGVQLQIGQRNVDLCQTPHKPPCCSETSTLMYKTSTRFLAKNHAS